MKTMMPSGRFIARTVAAVIFALNFLCTQDLHCKDTTPPPSNLLRYEGKVYEDIQVKSISTKGVEIQHSKGGLAIPLEKLPASIATPFKQQVQTALIQLQLERKAAADKRQKEEAEAKVKEEKDRIHRELTELVELELKQKQEKYPGYEIFEIKIVQVLPGGLLADKMQQSYNQGITSSFGKVGAGGAAWGGFYSSRPSGKIIFLEGTFKGAYDDQVLKVSGYPEDVYSYTDVRGSVRTVQRWVSVP